MEESDPRKLCSLIEKATHSISPEVDPRLLKAIKYIVRSSDAEVRVAVKTLMENMKKDHAQVRYLALLIIDELFMRSKLFRSLLVVNFDQFLSLSVGFRKNQPLPPPRTVASVLRSKSIEFLEKWHGSFGIHYRQLRSAFDYLKHTLMFQFPNRLEAAARLQQERREREIRSKEILLSKFETLRGSYSSIKGEIQSALDEITECLDIVRVKEDEFVPMGSVEEDGVVEFRSFSFQQLRLVSLKEGKRVHENSDNKAVFDVLRELYKLLVSRHLSSVQEWISVLVRVDSADNEVRDSILKEFIDLQNSVRAVKKRCEQLGFALPTTLTREEEEDLWEEGKIEMSDSENIRAPNMPSEEIASSSVADAGNGKAPDCSKTLKSGKVSSLEGDGSRPKSSKRKLFSEAPVMPWGSFLDSWGSSSDVLANQRGLEVEGHWGRVDYDAVIPAKKIAELNVQVTVYKEQHQEIRPCLAPLSKGGLCQRRDLRMCPFHGPIVPRDVEGNPINRSEPSVSDKTAEELSTLVDGENCLELGNTIAEQLARQAIKNVRNRDGEEKKKEDYKRSMKRVQLAKVREHNETVLRNAALSSTSRSEAIGGDVATVCLNRRSTKGRKQTLASMLREKVTTKDRIAKKLLNSNVTDAAVRQLRQGEEANYREAFPNQW
ncbi:UV-stimulated scaffold protein A isoform X1 [Cinnamomum micranthum f. kanehirae]|uniref:UV-stimulated scaffold protein A isoform X1 n=1 Tax=Cinnamomum micranthum f. kanehirae TaxID=337451 RepID=A0A3S3P9E0_9MAGN|nr:UV-stimulated scaffold protein A isoform X1 [Cinnamomum micranthum f. kanehirae]